MEVGPHAEQLETIAAQPDFLEVYGDRELTVFGITGRLQDLAGMCPVDLSDPRVTLEAKNEFVVKVANESGLEIAPEHVPYFSQVVEKHGQERKFTVATSDQQETSNQTEVPKTRAPQEYQPPKQTRPEIHAQQAAKSHIRPDRMHAKQAERGSAPTRKEVVSVGVATVALAAKVHADAFRREFGRIGDQPEVVAPSKVDKVAATSVRGDKKPASKKGDIARKPRLPTYGRHEVPVLAKATATLARPEVVRPAAKKERVRSEEPPIIETADLEELELIEHLTPEDFAFGLEDIGQSELTTFERDVEDISVDLSEIDSEALPGELSLPPVVTPDTPSISIEQMNDAEAIQPATTEFTALFEQAPESVDKITWDDAADKEPLELFDDFTQALQAVILESAVAQVEETDNPIEPPIVQLNSTQQVDETEPKSETDAPVPVITKAVADRLQELADEEQKAVAPVIQKMIRTTLVIEALGVDEAETEIVEAAMAQLEEQVVVLFEELGIEYTAEDIEQFIRVLLRPDFQPPPQAPAALTADLRTEATHEAKWHVAQLLTDSLDEIEYETGHLLGKLALFYASSKKHSVIAVA